MTCETPFQKDRILTTVIVSYQPSICSHQQFNNYFSSFSFSFLLLLLIRPRNCLSMSPISIQYLEYLYYNLVLQVFLSMH